MDDKETPKPDETKQPEQPRPHEWLGFDTADLDGQ
jgi:hypothetical protein